MSDITVSVTAQPAITVNVTNVGAQGPAGEIDQEELEQAIGDYFAENPPAGGVWGEITGTLADQTDLQDALDGKVDDDDSRLTDARTPTAHTHTASQVTDFDTEVSNNTDVAANTAARHTHANSAVLDATTASFTTADETKLDGIAAGATANATDAALRDRSTHTGTQTAATISDFDTAADARVTAGITGKLDTSAAPELIRDTIGTALVAGTNITITVNDGSDTITIDATGGGSADPEVRHDSDSTYSYMGSAPSGTAEGSSGWTVTRITLTSPPVVETGTGTWTGRVGLTYS